MSVRSINLDIIIKNTNAFTINYAEEDKLFSSELTDKMQKLIEGLSKSCISILSLVPYCYHL